MQRDLNLVREILKAVEASPDHLGTGLPSIEGHDRRVVAHHVWLLRQAGYLHSIDQTTTDGKDFAFIHLTWAGHEFLDSLRSDASWRKVLESVRRAGGSLSFDLIKEIGISAAKEALRLP
ncbi:DUF2513 domain-containing protein [Elioraea rosea]|uniref:DUF2513 domain-containing protein n=1 Tax=Elioraea rosea TaxID=2492390 RepID=UPI0011843EB0|nr:DUF2513 domain-containing protein [Elioraea rosea]